MERNVKTVELREDEQVQLQVKEFKENKYLDVRVYFQSSDGSMKLPSKKGLTIRAELARELLEKLEQLLKEEEIT